MNRVLILLLGVVSVGFCTGTFHVVFSQKKDVVSEESKPVFASEFYDEAVRKQVEPLREQSLEESLNELDRLDHYLTLAGSTVLESSGQKPILSSRIFRKCVEEMKLLPPKESARLIESHIDRTLRAYTNAYKRTFDIYKYKLYEREGWAEKEGKEQHNLDGLRYKLFALLLIAGTCELHESHASVKNIAGIAMDQKKNVSEQDAGLQKTFLTRWSLWEPRMLSAGLYGTHPHKDLPEFNDIAKRYVEKSLVDYTARYTEYDPMPFKEVVPDKDYIKVRYFEQATDEDVLLLMGLTDQ